MAKRLRVGRHHGVTIVEHDGDEDRGRLVAVVAMAAAYEVAGAFAQEVCAAVNDARAGREQGVSRSLPRSDPGRIQVADRLVEAALFLRMHGERPPGAPTDPAGETWAGWDREAETYLRSREVPGGS